MHINIYCDESRQDGHRWMLIGGTWIPKNSEEGFDKICEDFRARTKNTYAFFKWTKVSKKKLKDYKKFIDIFFEYRLIHFSCIIIDTHGLDYKTYHEDDRELGFYKFYYLMLSRNMEIRPVQKYVVFTAKRQIKKAGRLQELREFVNRHLKRRFSIEENLVLNIEPREPRAYNQLQLADIFMGAIGYNWEGYTTSESKLELCRHIASKFRPEVNNLSFTTRRSARKFNIWKLRLRV